MVILFYLIIGALPGYLLAGKLGILIGCVIGLLLHITDLITNLTNEIKKIN